MKIRAKYRKRDLKKIGKEIAAHAKKVKAKKATLEERVRFIEKILGLRD